MALQPLDPVFSKCNIGSQQQQLILNTFANGANSPFTYNCCEVGCDAVGQPPYPCSWLYSLTICIGGPNQQHACGCATDAGLVQWTTKFTAPRCSNSLLTFMSVQAHGVAMACCDSEFTSCAAAFRGAYPASYGTSGYTCDGEHSLSLCVSDGSTSAECITPTQNNAICSGNFSAISEPNSNSSSSASPSSTLPNTTASSPLSPSPSSSSGKCHHRVIYLDN